jgi:hypothetical protein
MKNRRFFPILLAAIATIALTWTAPATAGTWSGSTPDNGMGQSVSGQGSSTEVEGPPCTITYTSTTTITVTDNATGRVVSTTTRTRMRKYKIKNCPKDIKVVARAKTNDVLLLPVVPGSGIKPDIEGISSASGSTTVTNNPDGSRTTQKTEESSGAGSYKRSDSTTNTDGKGNVTGGTSRTVTRVGGKRTVTGQNWDPKTGGWVNIPTEMLQLNLQSTSLILPDSASRGGYAEGTVLVNFTAPDGSTGQTAASSNVTITEPNGKHHSLRSQADVVLTYLQLMKGLYSLLLVGRHNTDELRVGDNSPATQPVVANSWTNPPVVTTGSSLKLDGSGLATGDGPTTLACTRAGCEPVKTLAASDKQLKLEMPKLPPGPCSVIVENGNGKFSNPVTINPVDVALQLPKSGTVGQTLDAIVRLTGLMPQNYNRTLQATVNLLGPGTLAGGGMTQVVSIFNGVGHFKVIAHSAGTLDVNVRNVH